MANSKDDIEMVVDDCEIEQYTSEPLPQLTIGQAKAFFKEIISEIIGQTDYKTEKDGKYKYYLLQDECFQIAEYENHIDGEGSLSLMICNYRGWQGMESARSELDFGIEDGICYLKDFNFSFKEATEWSKEIWKYHLFVQQKLNETFGLE